MPTGLNDKLLSRLLKKSHFILVSNCYWYCASDYHGLKKIAIFGVLLCTNEYHWVN